MKLRLLSILLLSCTAFAGPAFTQEKITFDDNWGEPGFNLVSESPSGVEIVFSVPYIQLSPLMVNNELLTKILLPGALLGNDEGAPDLPGIGRYIALPQGASAQIEVVDYRSHVIEDIDLLPAAAIPRENDDSPPVYEKDPSIYGKDAAYPAQPVMISPNSNLRGVDVVTLGVTPFGYNPISRKLTVFTDIRIKVTFEGGNGHFGNDLLRNRWFEPLHKQHLLNYGSLSFVNFNSRPTGRDPDECEYMIFVPNDPDFITWAEVIKDFRVKQGISTNIFNIADLGGSANAIENKINSAYNTWTLKPVAALMLGDLPYMPVKTWNGYCMSDNLYADVTGNDMPDINVARMTARNAADLNLLINKFIGYETNPPTNQSFYDHPIIAGGWQTERWFILCTEVCLGFLANVEAKQPVREYAIYSGTPGSVWSTNQNTNMIVNYFGPNGLGYIPLTPAHLKDWGGNATRINNDINSGAFYMLHRDHGGVTGWGEPDYDVNDLNGLNNDDLCFVLSINCLTGKYDSNPQCFTEAFHRMNKGALGLIAASEVSYSFVNDTFIWGLHDSMWPNFDPGYGGSTGDNVLMPGFAQASGKWYLQASNWPYNTSNKDETYHLFHMHGDAFSCLYTEMPQNLTVSHAAQIDNTATSFDVSADAGSLIALSSDGEVLGTGTGTGGLTTIIIAPPGNPGIMYVTVTMPNCYRYEGQVNISTGGPLAIWPPDGTPASCLPGPPTSCVVKILDGVENYVPGSGKVYYRFDPADPYQTAGFTSLGNDLYEATIPGAAPTSLPEFYFSATGDGGSTVFCPETAPSVVFSMTLEPLVEIMFHDNCETNMGWTVQNISLSDGPWERGKPIGGGDRGDPPTDADGSGQCYLTDNEDGNSDVDGGPTILTSPMFDLSSGDANISYMRWHDSEGGTEDYFTVEISNDDGNTWKVVENIKDTDGWNEVNFMASTHVTPTGMMRMRFSAIDNPNDSVTEAGLDAFIVQRVIYDASLWADHYAVSCAQGAKVLYSMDAGVANANRQYLLLGSLSGSIPGFDLPGGQHVPLNWDSFTNFLIGALGTPVFQNFFGNLDGTGKGSATLDSLGAVDPLMVGQTLSFACILTYPPAWDFTSNAITLDLDP